MKIKANYIVLIFLLRGLLVQSQKADIQALWSVVDNVFDGTINRLDNHYLEMNNDTVEFYVSDSVMAKGVLSNDTIYVLNGFEHYEIDWIYVANNDSLISSPPNLKNSNSLSFTRIDLTGDWEQLNFNWEGGISKDTCKIVQERGSAYFYGSSDWFAKAYLKKDSIIITAGFEEIGIDFFTMYPNDSFDKVAPLVESIDRVLFKRIDQSVDQEYIPMLDSSYFWDIGYYSMGHICGYSNISPSRYFVNEDDTTLNNITYKKVYAYRFRSIEEGSPCPPFVIDTTPYLTHIFVREDVTGKKVYRYSTNTETEELLYDFDVAIGDTVYKNNMYEVIDTIYDIVTNDGLTRKCYSFDKSQLYEHGFSYGYMEGLGGPQGPFERPYVKFEDGYFAMCVKNASTIIAGYDCYDFATSVKNEWNQNKIEIYPVPAVNKLTINFNNVVGEKVITLYSISGKLLRAYNTSESGLEINTSSLESGLYIVKIIMDDRTEANYKVQIK